MSKQSITRSEIDNNNKWDLTAIYKDENELNNDIKLLDKYTNEVLSYKNIITKDASTLLKFLLAERNLSMLIEKIYLYVNFNYDTDCTNKEYNEKYTDVTNVLYTIYEKLSFITPELLKEDFAVIKKYCDEEPKLNEFIPHLVKVFHDKEHTLSSDKEEMLVGFSDIQKGFEKSFNIIKNSELKYGTFLDENNEKVELTNSNYHTYVSSLNAKVRKTVNELYLKAYEKTNGSIAEDLIGTYKYENYEAKLRGFKSALDEVMFSKNLDEKIYHNLIKTCNENSSSLTKYYKLVKKVSGLKTLHDYDINIKLIKKNEKDYSLEEAKKTIINGLSILGKDYTDILEKAFKEHWIDFYGNTGKTSGFYCAPNYVTNQFILANYEGKLYDVSALAHELGHAVNGYYSAKNNVYEDYQNDIFLAEVASLTNELLLSKYMLKNTQDKDEKLSILNHVLDLYMGNFFSATKGANFEYLVHTKLQNKEIVTKDTLNDIWLELLNNYYKKDVKTTKYSKYGWSVVPHFYYNYYYFQYATGISMATYIANKIFNKEDNMLEKYLEFLKAGSKKYPLDILKDLNIDMTKNDVIENTIKTFNELIDLYNEVYDS